MIKIRRLLIISLLYLVILSTAIGGCSRSGGEYNKTVDRPEACNGMEIVNSGYATALGDSIKANYDWIVFKDEVGNIYICRMNSKDNQWYITKINNRL